jgi:galactokinase
MGTTATIKKRDDTRAVFSSKNFGLVADVSLGKIFFDEKNDWANYPLGIVSQMQRDGKNFGGFEIFFDGNIPNGAGLSSSASIELATAFALNEVFSLGYSRLDLVKLSQKSENNFCGVNCGIMDMFAIGMGRKNFALHLNCGSLEYKYVPLELGGFKIIIMNTNKRRQLNESKYNERREECECALATLGEFAPYALEMKKNFLRDEIIFKRARHVISENVRVAQAVAALEAGDLLTLGALLTASHDSLRDDYEVSCAELDTIVASALKNPDCLGARMMGAGFGGCAIAIVKNDAAEKFISETGASYKKIIGFAPSMYVCETADGAREI